MQYQKYNTFPKSFWALSRKLSLRPWREKVAAGRMRGYPLGFTLIEILVVVLIIGILGAIAVPQYQRALLKSRYAALMPIAKSMANSNEAYYLEHGIYADDPQDLLIQGQSRYTDDTELEFGTVSDYAYVLAKNEDKIPNNTFVVYQKHSEEFPGEIHCEALADNDLAESVCKSFGGNESIGKTLTDGYETYVLFGTGNGVAPSGDNGGNDEPEESEVPVCEGVSCDEQGNITECASGLTLNNGECVTCDIANAATCSTTSYAAASCNEGYELSYAGTCVDYAQLQAQADSLCPEGDTRYSCTIKNGAVYRCDKTYGKIDAQTGECISKGTQNGVYESIYDAYGNEIEYYRCNGGNSGHCYAVYNRIPTGDGFKDVSRICTSKAAITKEGICSNGYSYGWEATYDSHGGMTSQFNCSASAISTTTGGCSTYTNMYTYDNSYSTNGERSFVQKYCTTVSSSNPASTCSNYQPVYSIQNNEAGTAYKVVQCYNSDNSGGASLNSDGTCRSDYPYVKSYDSATGQYTTCGSTAASVNWETATCK